MNLKTSFLLLALAGLSGCVNLETPLARTIQADPESGYVAAAFARYDDDHDGFALAFKREGSAKEVLMPIDPDAKHRDAHEPQVLVMKLPPGRYATTEWVTYAMGGREQTRGPVQSTPLRRSFVVEAGRVSVLGSFDLLKQTLSLTPVMKVRWAIETREIHEQEVRHGIDEHYPGLVGLRLDCLGCSK